MGHRGRGTEGRGRDLTLLAEEHLLLVANDTVACDVTDIEDPDDEEPYGRELEELHPAEYVVLGRPVELDGLLDPLRRLE